MRGGGGRRLIAALALAGALSGGSAVFAQDSGRREDAQGQYRLLIPGIAGDSARGNSTTPSATPTTPTATATPTSTASPTSTIIVPSFTGPSAKADAYTATEDVTLIVAAPGVLANDGGTPAPSAHVSTLPAHGVLVMAPDGSFSYTPAADYTGPDSFQYLASNGFGPAAAATVTLTVRPVDDPPLAVPDFFNVAEDSVANILDVLANDTDIDGGPRSVASVSPAVHGTVLVTPGGGSLTYTPESAFCGNTESFDYTLAPGGSSATVNV